MPRFLTALLLGLACQAALGQSLPRRPLSHRDTDIWNATTGMTLSPDGLWIAYVLTPPEGDAALVVKNVKTGAETRVPTGGKPPEGTPATAAAPTPAGGLQFAPDSKTLFAPLTPTAAETPKKKGKAEAKPPRPTLAVIDLASGKVTRRVVGVRGYKVVGKGAGTLITQTEPPADEGPAPGALAGGLILPPAARPKLPSDLVIRPLGADAETVLPAVSEYSVTKDDALLLAASSGPKAAVVALPLPGGTPKVLASAPGKFGRLTWDDKQARVAFTHAPTPAKLGEPSPMRILTWSRAADAASEVVAADAKGLPKGHEVAPTGRLDFSRDGLKLEFATSPKPEKPAKPEAAATAPARGARPGRGARGPRPAATPDAKPADAASEKVDLDLWHWQDEAIQPMQKLRAARERSKSFRAVYFFDTKVVRPLETEDRDVAVPNFGDWGLARSDKPYRGQLWRYPSPRDYSVVNVRTGEEKPLLSEFEGQLAAPFGDYAVGFDGTDWHSHAVPGGKSVNLTKSLGVRFDREEFDLPATAPPHGLRGWTKDRKAVVVSDRHDLWLLPLDGSIATNLTKVGRAEDIEFSIVPVGEDFSELELDFTKLVLLAAEHLSTRETGFYRLPPGGPPEKLVMQPRKFGRPTKAEAADVYLFTAQTFADYPDYYVAGPDFKDIQKVTDLQPRTREFNWGGAELVRYTSADGVPLSGVLIKPQDFDPAKKYPLIVYLYERLSDNVNNFRLPTAGTSINPTYYASNGYLILMPDITYTAGYPGQSALKCVLPAIQAVCNTGVVDENAIGIQGHSWGGYQAAYLVTQTTRFKAAAAGAPVSNMVSAYGGVRWGSGLPRQFQYERSQSRLGKTLWDAPTRYIENSPVFYADKVKTPLLMLHNDQDDAVPWYQGIEMYLALRRLGKEVYLLNYVGQPHGLRKKSAQRDYTVRMQQFFDHHLKGKPAPAWMRDGVPYTERDQEKGAIQKLFEPAGKQ